MVPRPDGDGFSDDSSISACARPSGYVGVPGDYDDLRASTNPEADEVCDNRDNDYDRDTDEDDAIDAITRYRDLDGDSYGDPDEPVTSTAPPVWCWMHRTATTPTRSARSRGL